MNPGRAVLVSGATGLIGAEVVDRLSPRRPVIAMTHRQPLLKRTDGSTLHSDEYGPWWSGAGIARLAADVREPGFGVAEQVLDELGDAVGCIVHAAATIAFNAPEAEYRRVNIAGTEHAIDLAQRWNVPLVHVSTAYVCGRRNGTISEHELDGGQEFSNGYERSKYLAERLVTQAPVDSVILRPAIVAGDATTGAVRDFRNLYTLLKLTVEGRLRRLPGCYDATLSLVPVDYVADAVVAATELVHAGDTSILGRTFHLPGAHTLSLREVSDVLAEYPSFEVGTFVPPTEFTVEDLDPIQRDYYERLGAQYTCYLDRIRTFDDTNTRTLLGLVPPATGVDYLRRLLDFCLAVGYLGRPVPSMSEILANVSSPVAGVAKGRHMNPMSSVSMPFAESDLTAEFFTQLLRERTGDAQVEVTAAIPTGSAVRGTLSAIVQTANPARFIGVAPLRLEFADRPAVDVMVKSKPLDTEMTNTLAAVMSTAGGDLTDAWQSCADASHFIGLHRREIGLYRDAPDAVKAITPKCFGTYEDAEQGVFLVVLERLDGNVEFLDCVDTPEVWTTERLETAIIGITGAHAHWLGREAELLGADSWVGRDDETPGMLPLWRAMYDQYRIDFPQWVDDATYDRATAVIDATPTWWAELVAMPRTLVHNDFNPRNIALRKGSGLVAYDWELATVQVPQRDLVDLLAHVLGPDASPESVDHFVEFQRRALESASGTTLDADVWRRGYQLSLADLSVNRLPTIALGQRWLPLPWFDHLVQTTKRLADIERDRSRPEVGRCA